MATPAAIIANVAALQNDAAQDVYTNAACLPYFNMALRVLEEEFQLYDIPSTFETSALIEVDAGVDAIGFGTTPALPANLIEIKQLWESGRGLENWVPMGKRDFLPHYLETDARISQLLVWAWIDQEIKLVPANADNDIKLDYTKSLFTPVVLAGINTDVGIINSQTYLEFKTASFCSMFIGENETRSLIQDGLAAGALDRVLGVGIKGRQPIKTRRKPFRAGFKARSRI